MITFKEDVRIVVYSSAIEWILYCLRQIDLMPDQDQPANLVVTSVNDGQHSQVPKSRHYTNEAIDVRSKNFNTREAKTHFAFRLEMMLNAHQQHKNCFSVIYEQEGTQNEHFHIQVRKGIIFSAP